jgi:uncharacterized integral membrane protein
LRAVLRWVVVAVVFVTLLLLALQNAEPARLAFFNLAAWEAPLVLIVFIAFATGVAAGLLAGAMRAARLKRQLGKLRRERGGEAGTLHSHGPHTPA